jgi:hypothetical protein
MIMDIPPGLDGAALAARMQGTTHKFKVDYLDELPEVFPPNAVIWKRLSVAERANDGP